MASPRIALPANSAEHHRRPSGRPLTYRGSHRSRPGRARRRAASLVAVALCAGLPATVAVRDSAPPPSPTRPAAVARPAARSAPTHAARASRSRVVAVPASAPVTQRRLVGFRTSVQQVDGRSFSGRATWYGPGFHGRRTANGERFDQMEMTAAHRTLPFGTRLRVCTRRRCVHVRVNDRGPFGRGNILDLSKGAAQRLGTEHSGVAWITATSVHTREVKVPVYEVVAPPPWTLRAERLSRPDPVAPVTANEPAPDVELVGEAQRWSALTSAGAVLGGLLILAVMALPAWRLRRRKGLSFVPRR